MAIQPGTHLGPYEIVSGIGAGGMGEVYRARDPKLGRDVAIKVLPEVFRRAPPCSRLSGNRAVRRAIALSIPETTQSWVSFLCYGHGHNLNFRCMQVFSIAFGHGPESQCHTLLGQIQQADMASPIVDNEYIAATRFGLAAGTHLRECGPLTVCGSRHRKHHAVFFLVDREGIVSCWKHGFSPVNFVLQTKRPLEIVDLSVRHAGDLANQEQNQEKQLLRNLIST